MSVSTYINAIKVISEDDLKLIKAYNDLLSLHQFEVAETVAETLRGKGYEVGQEESLIVDDDTNTVEVSMYGKGKGDVEYGDGLTLRLTDLPENTVAIRVYQTA